VKQAAGPYESDSSIDSHGTKKDGQPKTGIKSDLLGFLADHNSPINGEQPNAISQMPSGCKNAEYIESQDPAVRKFIRHDRIAFADMVRDGLIVQIRNQAESEIQNMKKQEEKQKNARTPLKNVKPIAGVTITESVRSRFGRNDNSVDRMKYKRNKDPEDLDEQQIRDVVNILDMLVKNARAIYCGRIRVYVNEKKETERDDARKLVQFSQKKGIA